MSYPSREAAYKAGAKALKALKAKGFRGLTPKKNIKVWENIGWHTCILHAHFGLYVYPRPRDGQSYNLLASPNGEGNGRPGWTVNGGPDPLKIFWQTMACADAEVAMLQKCIKDIR